MNPEKKAPKTTDVVARDTLHLGKRRVSRGERLTLPADQAERLLKSGAVTPPRETAGAAQSRPEGADLVTAIAAATAALDPVEDFNAEGKPSLPALAARLGYEVSAAERDAAVAAAKQTGGKSGPAKK